MKSCKINWKMSKDWDCGVVKVITACVIPNAGGWVGGVFVKKNFDWYTKQKKAPWNPPAAVFGPMWTALYSGMGYASYLVWRDGGGFDGKANWALKLYAGQLLLNWAWTPIYFGCHSAKWALVDIGFLGMTAGMCAVAFYEINRSAGLLMIPYLAWLGVATSLNFYNYKNNEIKD